MKPLELRKRIEKVGKAQRKSRKTISAYRDHALKYCRFLNTIDPKLPSEEKLRQYLEAIAPRVSAATQAQVLNALVWLYKHVLRKPLGDIGRWEYAQRPKTLPVWLTSNEVASLWPHMAGSTLMMAQLCFGSGIRRRECCSLRIKDLDMDAGKLFVRRGKGPGGGKDRVTCFPRSLRMAMETHLTKVRHLWESDRQANRPGVYLPHSLDRKYPKAPTSWPWFWVFPAAKESRDPETKIIRRHHIIPDTLRKAVRKAADSAALTKSPVGVHTLRHSFAVAMIEQGCGLAELAEMMGHKSIETTRIYLHCAERFNGNHQSPLDTAPIIEFHPGSNPVATALKVSQGICR